METTNELPVSAGRVDPRAVVVITVGDVQQVAQQTINRELAGSELMQVQKILEAGLGSRTEAIQSAIYTVLDYKEKRALRDVVLEALRGSDSLDSHEIISAFQQALTAFEEETDWDVTWSVYHKATVTAKTEIEALEEAAHYASKHDTRLDSDAYEVHEHED